MVRALILAAERQLILEDSPDTFLQPDQVRIKTLLSGISAGTELSQFRATSPFVERMWDERFRRFRQGESPSW